MLDLFYALIAHVRLDNTKRYIYICNKIEYLQYKEKMEQSFACSIFVYYAFLNVIHTGSGISSS